MFFEGYTIDLSALRSCLQGDERGDDGFGWEDAEQETEEKPPAPLEFELERRNAGAKTNQVLTTLFGARD